MNNNPSPGNKAGGLTTILEKSLGAVGEGRHDQPGRRLRVRRAGDGEGLRVHGHAGLRPGVGDGPGRGRREHDLLHHRPRLGVRLRAVAVAEARRPTRRCGSSRKTTSTSTAARSSTAPRPSSEIGRALLPADARHRVGRRRPRARRTATARTSSCRGISAP